MSDENKSEGENKSDDGENGGSENSNGGESKDAGKTEAKKEDSSISGRKIFFIYPTASVVNQVITELTQQEYEVYTVKDHVRMLRVLKTYSDAIIFINIDEGQPEAEWEKWVATINNTLPNVSIGILSGNSSDDLKEKYLNKLHASCGFTGLKVDMSKAPQKILDTLGTMDAKGRRKYLRASVERDTVATINLPFNSDFINGTVRDVSVVGVSCVFEHDPGLKKNTLLKDIQVRLQTMLLKVEGVIFGSREENGQNIYVLLFTQRIDPEVRVKIRKYIQQNLQARMDSEIG